MPLYRVLARGMKLPRIGTIRKGSKVPILDNGKPRLNAKGEAVMRPVEQPYWVIHVDAADDERTLETLYDAYGTREITCLNVYLLYPDADLNWSSWMEAYTAGQLVARSDERIITYLSDPTNGQTLIQDGRVANLPKNPKSPTARLIEGLGVGDILSYSEDMVLAVSAGSNEPITWKAVGRLSVVIKELGRPDRWFQMITGSYWYDIPFVYTAIDKVRDVARYTNRPANTIPLLLKRVPVETSYEDENGKKHRKTMHCVQLELRDDVVKGLMQAYEDTPFTFQLASRPTLPALGDGIITQAEYADSVETYDEGQESDFVGPEWNLELVEANQEGPLPVEAKGGSKAVARGVSIPVITPQFLVSEKIVPNEDLGAKLIALLMIDGASVEAGKRRIKLYEDWRKFHPRNDDVTRKFCAEKAIAGEVPPAQSEDEEAPF